MFQTLANPGAPHPGPLQADTKQAPRAALRLGRESLIDGPRRRRRVRAGAHPRAPSKERLIYSARRDAGEVPAEMKPALGPGGTAAFHAGCSEGRMGEEGAGRLGWGRGSIWPWEREGTRKMIRNNLD